MSAPPVNLDHLVQTVPCGLAAGRVDGTLTWTNGVLERWLGRSDLSGTTLQSVFSVASRMLFETHVRPLLMTEGIASELSCKLVRDDGEHLPVLLTAHYDPQADETSAVSYALFSAGDRVAYEKRLKKARAEADQLAAIVTSSPDGYLTLTRSGRIVTTNESAEAILIVDDLTGILIQDIFPDASDWLGELSANSCKRTRIVKFVRRSGRNGMPLDLEITLSPLDSVATDLSFEVEWQAGVSLIVRDVTQRMATRRRLETTVAELDHRVKNTLAIVQSVAAQTFRSEGAEDSRTTAFAARIRAMADAHDVLTERGWQDAELTELVTRTLQPVGGPSEVEIDGEPALLYTEDAVMLAIAIRELGDNAARHGALSRENGKVTVSWGAVPDSDAVSFVWQETGCEDASTSLDAGGFGRMVLEQALPAQFGKPASLRVSAQGLIYEIEIRTQSVSSALSN